MSIEELDEAAAREVMGWREPPPFLTWSPSSNEAQAALLREKLRAEGWEITAVSHRRGDTVTVRNSRIEYTWSAEVGQMPLAMTRAAVMAKRLEKEG